MHSSKKSLRKTAAWWLKTAGIRGVLCALLMHPAGFCAQDTPTPNAPSQHAQQKPETIFQDDTVDQENDTTHTEGIPQTPSSLSEREILTLSQEPAGAKAIQSPMENGMTISGQTFAFPSLSVAGKESPEDLFRRRVAENKAQIAQEIQGAKAVPQRDATGTLSCQDMLGGYMTLPEDADVNSVCSQCYTFCLMELVLKESLARQKHHPASKKLPQEIITRIHEDLAFVRAMLPPLLSSCIAAFSIFRYQHSNTRQRINELQSFVQNR